MSLYHPPADLDGYWRSIDVDLARYPAQPELTPLPMRSAEAFTVYAVRFTGVGPYRVFGYLSLPSGNGPHPALLLTPRYGSVNHIPDYNDRLRYVCLQLMHRGQRLADQPFAARYPGLLTHGIEGAETYIYRDIAADCLRGAELLLERTEVDRTRVALVGDDLALLTAARRPEFAIVQASGLMFYRMREGCRLTSSYPLQELNDFLRARPEATEDVENTLAYLEPFHQAGSISAEVTLSVGDPATLGGPEWLAPLAERLAGRATTYQLTHEGGTDHDRLDAMLAERLGVQPMSRFRRNL